jgi:hypothetical protein
MKSIWIWSGLMAVVILNSQASNISQVILNLEKLETANKLTTEIRGANNDQLARETQRFIQIYVREADQNDWATPSSERLKRLSQVADAMQHYTSLLVKLGSPFEREFKMEQGTVWGTEQYNQGILNLLSYAKPTDELRQELLQLANVPNPRGAARAAYNLIFQLGLDTPEVRQEIVKRMSAYQESDENTAAAEIYFSAGAEWRLEEALPLYIELLQSEYRSKEELNWRVRSIATAVRPLGSQAADILPLLQQQIARMKAENADFRDINVVEGAIRAIEGKDAIEPLLAVSGAGPVGKNPLPTSSTPTAAVQITSAPLTPAPVQQPIAAVTPTPTTEETKPSPWPWIVGAILLLAVVGGILLKVRRK